MLTHPTDPVRALVAKALEIRRLFCTDQETRNIFGGPPYTEDILSELVNEEAMRIGAIDPTQKRIRMGKAYADHGDPFTAYAGWTLVTKARPTAYERKYVWAERYPEEVDGFFLRRIVVHPNKRRGGIGATLIEETRMRAERYTKRMYADIGANNDAMRSLAMRTGGTPNMFWHTPTGTLMVRYLWS